MSHIKPARATIRAALTQVESLVLPAHLRSARRDAVTALRTAESILTDLQPHLALRARHTPECVRQLEDPGATCVCRPPEDG